MQVINKKINSFLGKHQSVLLVVCITIVALLIALVFLNWYIVLKQDALNNTVPVNNKYQDDAKDNITDQDEIIGAIPDEAVVEEILEPIEPPEEQSVSVETYTEEEIWTGEWMNVQDNEQLELVGQPIILDEDDILDTDSN